MNSKTENKNRRATLADVAREANVSIKTVSRVINDEPYVGLATRQRVLRVIREINYMPNRAAQRLASKSSHVVGIVVPSIDYPIFPIIMMGAEQVLRAHNYEILVFSTDVDPEHSRRGLALLAENQVDGVIMCSVKTLPEEDMQQVLGESCESVLINMAQQSQASGIVRVDIALGLDLLVGHLLEMGYRHIALLSYPKTLYSIQERTKGYRTALQTYGIPVDEDLIILCEDDQDYVYKRVMKLLQDGTPIDAFVCYNDLMASSVLRACLDLGVDVPGKVAITGFDNIPFTDLFKRSLTTISIPWFEVGVKSAEMLLNRIGGDYSMPEIIIQPELVIRETTA